MDRWQNLELIYLFHIELTTFRVLDIESCVVKDRRTRSMPRIPTE